MRGDGRIAGQGRSAAITPFDNPVHEFVLAWVTGRQSERVELAASTELLPANV